MDGLNANDLKNKKSIASKFEFPDVSRLSKTTSFQEKMRSTPFPESLMRNSLLFDVSLDKSRDTSLRNIRRSAHTWSVQKNLRNYGDIYNIEKILSSSRIWKSVLDQNQFVKTNGLEGLGKQVTEKSAYSTITQLNQVDFPSIGNTLFKGLQINGVVSPRTDNLEKLSRDLIKVSNLGMSATIRTEFMANVSLNSRKKPNLIPYQANKKYIKLITRMSSDQFNSKVWSDVSRVAENFTVEEVVANYNKTNLSGVTSSGPGLNTGQLNDDEKRTVIDAIKGNKVSQLPAQLKAYSMSLIVDLLIHFIIVFSAATPLGQSATYWNDNDLANYAYQTFEAGQGVKMNTYKMATVSNLSVRLLPRRSDSRIKCLLSGGEVVKVVERKGSWSRIQLSDDGGFGWVMNRYLKTVQLKG